MNDKSNIEEILTQLSNRIVQIQVSPRLVKVVETQNNHNLPDGVIIETCKKGYLMFDRILRPAEVISNRRTR